MATTRVYYPHGIDLNGTFIAQVRDVTPSRNLDELVEFAAGQTAPQYRGSHEARPEIVVVTTQVKDVLDAMTVSGLVGDFSAGNVDLYYKAGKSKALREADASLVHLRVRCDNAFGYWTRLTARQGAAATIELRIVPVYDGVNIPLVATGSVALSGTSVVDHIFTLGPLALNGSNLDALQGFEWENNVQAEEVTDSGVPYLAYGGVAAFAPRIRATTRDAGVFATYGNGTALTALAAYLRKKQKASPAPVADVTAEHIKLTATAGDIVAPGLTGLAAEGDLMIGLEKPDAASDPFAVDTASAIT